MLIWTMGSFMGLPAMIRILSPVASSSTNLPLPTIRALLAEPLMPKSLPLPWATEAKAVHSPGLCEEGTQLADSSGVEVGKRFTHREGTEVQSAGRRPLVL